MAQIKQDPQKLREFCDQLKGHVSYWQSSVRALDAHMARLGSSWRDDQFNEFAKEVTTLQSSLDKFAEETRMVISELLGDAEKLEQFQRIQARK